MQYTWRLKKGKEEKKSWEPKRLINTKFGAKFATENGLGFFNMSCILYACAFHISFWHSQPKKSMITLENVISLLI